jgi:hypothetical protein
LTGRVVNLRAARKARTRDDKRRQADENSAKFGRSKEERDNAEKQKERIDRHLDGHRRDP